jgi:nucleotide-binding universal stress UspA family protein
LGSNGKKGIQKWLGSVSQEIATASAVSTYISKKDNYAKKVLFAVNDVDLVINGLSEFISRMNLKDKIIYLTTVYETPDYLFLEGNLNKSWLEDVNKKQEFHASAILGKYEKIFNDSGLCINTRKILNGNPSAELIKYASEENVDLIVCLEREKSGLSKIILPSVSRRILENSLSDVILIKPDSH